MTRLADNDGLMRIRRFQDKDATGTADLFRDTVKRVNCRDYSPNQVKAWAPDDMDVEIWRIRLSAAQTFVAETEEGELLGFISVDRARHIDLLYCHADHQGKGAGSLLLEHMERHARDSGVTFFSAEASVTARPFFEKQGFRVIREQKVKKSGMSFINYLMGKRC
jgi:putative acetyltransferase